MGQKKVKRERETLNKGNMKETKYKTGEGRGQHVKEKMENGKCKTNKCKTTN